MGHDGTTDFAGDFGAAGLVDLIGFAAGYAAPRARVPVREWAPTNIDVPASVNPDRHGPLSWDGYEYAPDVLERILAPETRIAVICAPPQFIKTFLATVGMLYIADQIGGPQLYVTTIEPKRDEFFAQKLEPLVMGSRTLSAKIPRDGTGRPNREFWNRGRVCLGGEDIFLGHAGSAAALASTTARVFWGDEPAKWKNHFKAEGGAVGLGKMRVKAFPESGKVILFSTPPQILDEENDYWTHFTSGTVTRLFLPCPHCDHRAPLGVGEHWGLEGDPTKCFSIHHRAKKDDKGKYNLSEVEATAYAICPACGREVHDPDKPGMVRRYEMVDANPAPDPGVFSFWLNRLYQPGVRFGKRLSDWMIACRTERGMMEDLLQEMAQPYRPRTNKVDVGQFKHMLADYELGRVPAECPAVSLVLTADVQEIEVPWTIWAVVDQQAWLVNYGEGYELLELLDVSGNAADALSLPLHGGFVDAGHRTRDVYQFCADTKDKFIPVHGRDMQKLIQWSKDLDAERGLKHQSRKPRVVKALLWQNYSWKTELYNGIIGRKDEKPPSVKLWLPKDIVRHPKFLRQLSAEKLEIPKRGRPVWRDFRANHWGDCTCELLVYLEVFRGRLRAPTKIKLPEPVAQASGW